MLPAALVFGLCSTLRPWKPQAMEQMIFRLPTWVLTNVLVKSFLSAWDWEQVVLAVVNTFFTVVLAVDVTISINSNLSPVDTTFTYKVAYVSTTALVRILLSVGGVGVGSNVGVNSNGRCCSTSFPHGVRGELRR